MVISQDRNQDQKPNPSLPPTDRREILGGGIRLLAARHTAGMPILAEHIVRLAEFADDADPIFARGALFGGAN